MTRYVSTPCCELNLISKNKLKSNKSSDFHCLFVQKILLTFITLVIIKVAFELCVSNRMSLTFYNLYIEFIEPTFDQTSCNARNLNNIFILYFEIRTVVTLWLIR